VNLQSELFKLEQHLHRSMFGGIFGAGWPGQVAPRIVFYTYSILFAIMWIAISAIGFLAAGNHHAIVTLIQVISICFLVVHVLDSLVVTRGSHALEGWRGYLTGVNIPAELLAIGLATIVFQSYKTLSGQDKV
jgi:hypothetical protein